MQTNLSPALESHTQNRNKFNETVPTNNVCKGGKPCPLMPPSLMPKNKWEQMLGAV